RVVELGQVEVGVVVVPLAQRVLVRHVSLRPLHLDAQSVALVEKLLLVPALEPDSSERPSHRPELAPPPRLRHHQPSVDLSTTAGSTSMTAPPGSYLLVSESSTRSA